MITTTNFTFDKNLGKMYAEISELEGFWPKERIQLKSHRTGRVVNFVLTTIKRDRDHDIVTWEYVPTTPVHNLNRVVIFND